MRPTIDDQVAGARRLVQTLVEGDGLPHGARETLLNVRRLLEQIGRSWADLPGFYAADNAELATLLERACAVVPPATASRITAAVAVDTPAATDVRRASGRNADLRELLSAVLRELPSDPAGRATRTEIGKYLRRRVETDPV